MDVNILAQIGFVVLVGLAAKNAILIVEFARQGEEQGLDRREAATAAARTRLRPILMTSFAFIFGVIPLAIATGAGAEMRQSLGTAVVFGMLGVTLFGLIFTPVFYVACRRLALLRRQRRPAPTQTDASSRLDPGPGQADPADRSLARISVRPARSGPTLSILRAAAAEAKAPQARRSALASRPAR